ncbi:MAG: hypothetical protein L0H15_11330 [Nitrosospira sp.]|nr:hypothetical protein [Nitrosospira sp.]
MKPVPILKSSAARFLVLAGIMIFGAASMSHAQTHSEEKGGAPVSGQGWGDAAKEGTTRSQKNRNSASTQGTPDQADSSSGWSSAEGKSGSCRYTTPDRESFLCKIKRIFYDAETPRGPNRDMDENISAGGAGG